MPTNTVLQSYSFRDSRGMTSTMKFWVTTDNAADAATLGGAITTALAAMTNAHITSTRGSYADTPEFGYGSDAQYAPIEDKASLTYVTQRQVLHRFRVPAPKATVFMADEQTVDPADTLIVAFNTAFLDTITNTFVSDALGNPLTGYVGGIRTRSPLRRKVNIYTLNPAETGPDE